MKKEKLQINTDFFENVKKEAEKKEINLFFGQDVIQISLDDAP